MESIPRDANHHSTEKPSVERWATRKRWNPDLPRLGRHSASAGWPSRHHVLEQIALPLRRKRDELQETRQDGRRPPGPGPSREPRAPQSEPPCARRALALSRGDAGLEMIRMPCDGKLESGFHGFCRPNKSKEGRSCALRKTSTYYKTALSI